MKMSSFNPRCLGGVLAGGLALVSVAASHGRPVHHGLAEVRSRARMTPFSLPLSFQANRGQTDSQVRFLARGNGFDVFLTPSETVLRLKKAAEKKPSPLDTGGRPQFTPSTYSVVRMQMLGANPAPEVSGEHKLPGESNYFRGRDRSRWVRNVPHFSRVRYRELYRGVDAVYYGNANKLEYDLVVAPGADPSQVRMSLKGADQVRIENGDLVIETAGGELRQHRPSVYQEKDGKREPVEGRYKLVADARVGADPVIAFELGEYDRSRELVIDPVLAWSTFLGGSLNDQGNGIDVDQDGFVYVTGTTFSPDFPVTAGAFQTGLKGTSDAFVTKMTNDGSTLVYSTYIGGSGYEQGFGISVHSSGRAFITGATSSTDFPIASPPKTDPAQPNYGGGSTDVFVTALEASGADLFYSTYYGSRPTIKGDGTDIGYAIAVDLSGNAYITGATSSFEFPLIRPIQSLMGGGGQDAFVLKLNVLGQPDFCTFLGGGAQNYMGGTDYGEGIDVGYGIAVDPNGYVYATGCTSSKNFPVFNNLQRVNRSVKSTSTDVWVAKFIPGGKQLQYCTYLGGNNSECGLAIAADAEGNAYVTGVTRSNNLATQSAVNSIHRTARGADDVFFAKINSAGFQLMSLSYLGGSDNDEGHGIAVDSAGNVFITGATSSVNFPVTRPMQARFGGLYDTFVMKIDPTGRRILYSGYFGSNNQDYGNGIAVDDEGNAYVVGTTFEDTFPTTVGSFQKEYGGGESDAFVAKITDDEVVTSGGRLKVPKQIRFGKCPVNTTVTRYLTIRNAAKKTLTGTVHGLDAGPFRVDSNGGPFSLGPKSRMKVRVMFTPDGREKMTAFLYVSSSDPRSPVKIIKLQGTGR
jgi:hypothetical protein